MTQQLPQLKWDRLSDDTLEELVAQVKKRPTLYDTNHPHYGKTPAREECWASISDELLTITRQRIANDLLKNRWRNLRDAYIKLYRKKEAGLKLNLIKRKADLMKTMNFLIPFIGKRSYVNPAQKGKSRRSRIDRKPYVQTSDGDDIQEDFNDTSFGNHDNGIFGNHDNGIFDNTYEEDNEKEMIQSIPDIIGYHDDDEDDTENSPDVEEYSQGTIMCNDHDDNMIVPEDNNLLNYIKIVNISSLRDKNISKTEAPKAETFQAIEDQDRDQVNGDLQNAALSVLRLTENELFFLSMSKIVDKLSVDKQIELRRQINGIVSVAQLQNSRGK